MPDLIVSEIFGPTFAGEGRSVGQRAIFLRLGLCNLSCGWCDTPYTWDWSGKNGPPQDRSALLHVPVEQVADDLAHRAYVGGANLVVITGGEPMVQQRRVAELIADLPGPLRVEIETNGTIAPALPEFNAAHFNVSPKLAHADTPDALNFDALVHFAARGADFKFVVAQRSDLEEVFDILEKAYIDPAQVWIMPEGRDSATIIRRTAEIADAVLEAGYNLTTRLHVIAWEDQRAR